MTRRESARNTNNRIAQQAASRGLASMFPMVCECDDPLCTTVVLVSLREFEQLRAEPADRLVAAGHAPQRASVPVESSPAGRPSRSSRVPSEPLSDVPATGIGG